MIEFDDLPLHDTVIKSIEINWDDKHVVVNLSQYNADSGVAENRNLIFINCLELKAPHYNPWGESSCINDAFEGDGEFIFEMQSGDIITFVAESFKFE